MNVTSRAITGRTDHGFAMVALLVGMSVAAIWMAALLPAWRQQAQRQREEDLIFRGEQYARAIVLYQDKNRGAFPPSIDVLVSGNYLRKKWKDPITGEDFVPLGTGVSLPGGQSPQQQTQGPGRGQPQIQTPGRGGAPQAPGGPGQQTGQSAGITGVRSKSTATSIKVYQQQQQYSLWPFDGAMLRARMGRQIQGPQQPGGRPGGPGGQRGGPGGPGAGQPGRGGPGGGPGGRAGSPLPPPPIRPGGAAGS